MILGFKECYIYQTYIKPTLLKLKNQYFYKIFTYSALQAFKQGFPWYVYKVRRGLQGAQKVEKELISNNEC